MAHDIQYNTPQDKLLVMLLERISTLEDTQTKLLQAVEKSNAYVESLISKSSSVYFSICMKGKLPPPNNNANAPHAAVFGQGAFINFIEYNAMRPEKLDTVKNIIANAFPQCCITVARSPTTTFYLEFESPMLLDTLKDTLELPLLHHVHILSWSILSKSEMATILHRSPYEM
jgi:hypothetical protein